MSRSTFSGPVLVGDNRFGALRNVGTAELVQGITLNLANVTPGTAGYAGGSGVFAASNNVLNTQGYVYTPGSNPATLQTITADTSSIIYRGVVFYTPVGAGAVPYRITGTTPAVQTAFSQNGLTDRGMVVTATGDANGAVGDLVGVHYTAEAEI